MAGMTPEASASRPSTRSDPAAAYREVRRLTEALCEPLAIEDHVVQSMEDVSPTKWHLAHTSWFFETFILSEHLPDHRTPDPAYPYLFNSYYVQAGERHCRDQRGYISRPTVAEVYEYRRHVDASMRRLLDSADASSLDAIVPLLEVGLNHEQQHQELLLTDIKHVFGVNPLRPAYRASEPQEVRDPPRATWVGFPGGIASVGHAGEDFAYDNERPRHRVYLEPFELASIPVTNAEYLEFMEDGGYRRPELWLSLGWATAQEEEWSEPFYWEKRDDQWWIFTLRGMSPVVPQEPVCHLSYFEAEAFARWAGARLPTEAEWEVAAREVPVSGNLVDSGLFHPSPAEVGRGGDGAPGLRQMFGDVWEWTRSPYAPYPGYQTPEGALGEYNGKFMCNQFVLRGGSCATSRSHIRPSYRNFFPPEATWQFSGVRLARDI